MDLTWARSLYTVICFGSFLIIILIVLRKGGKKEYDQIANNVVDDDDLPHEKNNAPNADQHDHGAK